MAVYLCNFQGTLLSGAETFQHSIAVDAAGETTPGEFQNTVLSNCVDAINALMNATTGIRSHLPSTTAYTNVRVSRVLGLTTGRLFAAVNQSVSLVGTGGNPLPPQLACAISLQGGDRGNGTPYRGRFYLPAPDTTRLANGLWATSSRAQYEIGVENFMNALDVDLENTAPQIWSRKDGVTVNVDAVRLGVALDTIRSRRRDIPEAYLLSDWS